jgi:uncharacterized protein (DUF1919 family)
MTKTFITNDCLAYFMYKKLGAEYQSPFIGSLFESDLQFLQFCKGYKEYMQIEPHFAPPFLPVTVMGNENAPVMFLGDIEIHWPHEKGTAEALLEKFKTRRARMEEPTFIWSDMQIFNEHSDEERAKMIAEFKALPNAIFVAKDDIEIHKAETLKRQADKFFSPVKWLDYDVMATHLLK